MRKMPLAGRMDNGTDFGMRILHTSDLHLGHRLYGRRREEEQKKVLSWIVAQAREREVDMVVVCGDVFDTSTPAVWAQEQYYGFLRELVQAGVRHTVLIAGNHDSPSFLAVAQGLVRPLGIHVVTAPEVMVFDDPQNASPLAILAVPYLRERDVREPMPAASLEEKVAAWVRGVGAVYHDLARQARDMAPQAEQVALGHLFVAGSRTREGDGMRVVGGLDRVPASIFPPCHYVALGHVHGAQAVAGLSHVRYSGAPLALGFADADQDKSVTVVTVTGVCPAQIETIRVPCFQPLLRLHGTLGHIEAGLAELVEKNESIWVEVELAPGEAAETARRRIESLVEKSPVDVLCLRLPRVQGAALSGPTQRLEELSVHEVFSRLLETFCVENAERQALQAAFDELVRGVFQEGEAHAS